MVWKDLWDSAQDIAAQLLAIISKTPLNSCNGQLCARRTHVFFLIVFLSLSLTFSLYPDASPDEPFIVSKNVSFLFTTQQNIGKLVDCISCLRSPAHDRFFVFVRHQGASKRTLENLSGIIKHFSFLLNVRYWFLSFVFEFPHRCACSIRPLFFLLSFLAFPVCLFCTKGHTTCGPLVCGESEQFCGDESQTSRGFVQVSGHSIVHNDGSVSFSMLRWDCLFQWNVEQLALWSGMMAGKKIHTIVILRGWMWAFQEVHLEATLSASLPE